MNTERNTTTQRFRKSVERFYPSLTKRENNTMANTKSAFNLTSYIARHSGYSKPPTALPTVRENMNIRRKGKCEEYEKTHNNSAELNRMNAEANKYPTARDIYSHYKTLMLKLNQTLSLDEESVHFLENKKHKIIVLEGQSKYGFIESEKMIPPLSISVTTEGCFVLSISSREERPNKRNCEAKFSNGSEKYIRFEFGCKYKRFHTKKIFFSLHAISHCILQIRMRFSDKSVEIKKEPPREKYHQETCDILSKINSQISFLQDHPETLRLLRLQCSEIRGKRTRSVLSRSKNRENKVMANIANVTQTQWRREQNLSLHRSKEDSRFMAARTYREMLQEEECKCKFLSAHRKSIRDSHKLKIKEYIEKRRKMQEQVSQWSNYYFILKYLEGLVSKLSSRKEEISQKIYRMFICIRIVKSIKKKINYISGDLTYRNILHIHSGLLQTTCVTKPLVMKKAALALKFALDGWVERVKLERSISHFISTLVMMQRIMREKMEEKKKRVRALYSYWERVMSVYEETIKASPKGFGTKSAVVADYKLIKGVNEKKKLLIVEDHYLSTMQKYYRELHAFYAKMDEKTRIEKLVIKTFIRFKFAKTQGPNWKNRYEIFIEKQCAYLAEFVKISLIESTKKTSRRDY